MEPCAWAGRASNPGRFFVGMIWAFNPSSGDDAMCVEPLSLAADPSLSLDVRVGVEPLVREVWSGGRIYHPRVHILLHPSPWVESLRDHLRLPELVEYYHKGAGTFCLGGWLPSGRTFMELENYENDRPWWVGGDCRPHTNMDYLGRLRQSTQERARVQLNRIDAWRAEERAKQVLEGEERKDAAAFMRSKGLRRQARDVEEGRVPWVGKTSGGDELAQMTADMTAKPQVFDMGGV